MLRIRELRKAKGWSIRELARQADVSYTTVADMEPGRQLPNQVALEKIAKALGVTVEQLYK